MNIKQFSKITGLSAHTLRYYEKVGLLLDVRRDSQGYRNYSEQDVRWIEFLNRLKATGMSLADMKTSALLRKKGDSTIGERIKLLEQHQAKVETELESVTEHLEKIKAKIAFYKKMQKNKNNS